MDNRSKIRVAIVDDHNVVIKGIEAILKDIRRVQVVAIANSGKEIMKKMRSTKPDLVLMDINMPDLNGIQTTKLLTKRYKNTKVLGLSVNEDEMSIKKMLTAGASGYLMKDESDIEIIKEAINKVLSGEIFYSPKTSGTLISRYMSTAKKKPKKEEDKSALTKREKQILRYIGKEHTNAEIGNRLGISVRTVEAHRRRIIQKLGVRNSIGLIKYVLNKNFIGD